MCLDDDERRRGADHRLIAAIAAVIVAGLVRSQPVVAPIHTLPQATDTVGVLLIPTTWSAN